MKSFYKKNELGVNIEYSIIGYCNDDNRKYVIYTDFVDDDNELGMRLFVAKMKGTKMYDVSDDIRRRIIDNLYLEMGKTINNSR